MSIERKHIYMFVIAAAVYLCGAGTYEIYKQSNAPSTLGKYADVSEICYDNVVYISQIAHNSRTLSVKFNADSTVATCDKH